MKQFEQLVHELSEHCGIMHEYWDIFGEKRITSVETKIAILRAMQIRTESVEDITREINARKNKKWMSFLEPVHVFSVNEQPLTFSLYVPVREDDESKMALAWSIHDEKGQSNAFDLSGEDFGIAEEKWLDGVRYIRIEVTDREQRQSGYYDVHVECRLTDSIIYKETDVFRGRTKIILSPDSCYIPPEFRNSKAWGLSVNLYAIRSEQNWGIGEFSDLQKIVEWTAELGGDFVGINPLHAIPNSSPYGISPYSPLSRLYRNFIYLTIETIPDIWESDAAQTLMRSESFEKELNQLRTVDHIDYERVAELKHRILRVAFESFYEKHFISNTPRGETFRSYLTREGRALESFARFLSLWQHMKETAHLYSWQDWPKEFHDPQGKAVLSFRKLNEKDILYYQYVQWLIDQQLQEIHESCKRNEMTVGLYNDLAIGAVGGGSDAWSFQEVMGIAAAGAPPDDFNSDGQNWGFPPMIPERLRETGYELFIRTIQKNMKYGGALRIDHALGLFRLFWIPSGMKPAEGAYVECASEDLLRIVALESVRNKTMVIAEDLGTIGDNVREALSKFEMLSYRLFYFERNYPDPSFALPDEYPEMALCAVTTHDLPTLYGYWVGHDIHIRKGLGMYADNNLLQQQLNERKRDRGLILSALKNQGVLPDAYSTDSEMVPQMTPELCIAIYRYLAGTPCRLLLVNLDDIIGTLNQQNMPGTVDTHPNWVQKTPLSLDEIMKDERFTEISKTFRKM